ncbi:MAG: hypothetical protein DHS20C13_22070 [Thermodesulfobacteriota bacterium]|nr:MAG: hypothetical protein DHS20C13_22070 [Thermodesulfobacteriota bacterium]GJM35904.1 MAG: hypothetical protein DHS20C18_49050 [Saprospiraceae bacterium]
MINKDYSKEQLQPSRQIHQSDPSKQPILLPFIKLYGFIISVGAVPVRLLFFKNIGERSISMFSLLTSLGAHFGFVYLYGMTYTALTSTGVFFFTYGRGNLFPDILNEWHAIFYYGSILLINGVSIYFIRVFVYEGYLLIRKKTSLPVHLIREKSSYYRGDPRFSNPEEYIGKVKRTFAGKQLIDEDRFRIFIEPQTIMGLGIIVMLLFIILAVFVVRLSDGLFLRWIVIFLLSYSTTGILVFLGGVCLALEEYGIAQRIRYAALDMIDGKLDMKKILEVRKDIESESNKKRIDAKRVYYPTVKIH